MSSAGASPGVAPSKASPSAMTRLNTVDAASSELSAEGVVGRGRALPPIDGLAVNLADEPLVCGEPRDAELIKQLVLVALAAVERAQVRILLGERLGSLVPAQLAHRWHPERVARRCDRACVPRGTCVVRQLVDDDRVAHKLAGQKLRQLVCHPYEGTKGDGSLWSPLVRWATRSRCRSRHSGRSPRPRRCRSCRPPRSP